MNFFVNKIGYGLERKLLIIIQIVRKRKKNIFTVKAKGLTFKTAELKNESQKKKKELQQLLQLIDGKLLLTANKLFEWSIFAMF